MIDVLELLVELHADRPRLHALLHRMVQPRVEDLPEVQAFEARICDEVAFHLKRCDRGGDDVEATAQTLVYAIDAQLHRVMTSHGFDVEALMRTVTRLAPPPGRPLPAAPRAVDPDLGPRSDSDHSSPA
jgi:hypothetical protein